MQNRASEISPDSSRVGPSPGGMRRWDRRRLWDAGDIGRHILDADGPRPRASVGQVNTDIADIMNSRLDFICPFDQNDGLGIAEIVEAEHLEISDRRQPVR